jgi:hypothetical protein
MRNPPSPRYLPPLDGELLDAYVCMPTLNGHVISLFYTPPARLAAYEEQWREWLAEHPRHLWPEWVEQWSLHRKAQAKVA